MRTLLLLFLSPTFLSASQDLRVGPGAPFSTITEALVAAGPGDTISVAPGHYRERLVIDRPVVLIGEAWPIIDGGGHGHVIEALAPISISGFVIRSSGDDVDREDSGLMVRAGPSQIVDNQLDDVLYGVYVKQAPGSLVAGNRVVGKPLALARRGDGIRLWYSAGTQVLDNDVRQARDLVVYFSDSLSMRGNRVLDGRYGLHYMYSNHSLVEDNWLAGNQVGAFLMYSTHLQLSGNVFAGARGATGMGLGLKDADRVSVSNNLILRNAVGVHLDNSPRTANMPNEFRDNAFAYNGMAVRLLPAVANNHFVDNAFSANGRPVGVAGGAREQVAQNQWAQNYWSEYVGFDEDGDGIGDTPFSHVRFSDELLSRHPDLRFFSGSPALSMLDRAMRFFPLLRPIPMVVDSTPRLDASALDPWRASMAQQPIGIGREDAAGGRWSVVVAAMTLGAMLLIWGVVADRGRDR